jgi:membrane protein implicated in regulation of membrane protease activity
VAWTGVVGVVCFLANGLAMAGFAALLVALAALWVLWVRRRFAGPRVDLAHYESRPAPRR